MCSHAGIDEPLRKPRTSFVKVLPECERLVSKKRMMLNPAGLTIEAEQMVGVGPVGLAQVVDVLEESFLVQVGDAA